LSLPDLYSVVSNIFGLVSPESYRVGYPVTVASDVVEQVREAERVVPVVERIRVGGARATGVCLLCFFHLFFVLTAEFASV